MPEKQFSIFDESESEEKTKQKEGELVGSIFRTASIEVFKKSLRNSGCKACNLGIENDQKPTTSRGNEQAKIIMVGEAPGYNEMVQGIPFVGRAGQLNDKMLSEVGFIVEKDLYISNICRCRPENNRTPKVDEAKTCIAYLKHEIELLKPWYILCLGTTSAKYILGNDFPKGAMKDIVGKYYVSESFPNQKIYVIYHPAALLYTPKLQESQREMMMAFYETYKGK